MNNKELVERLIKLEKEYRKIHTGIEETSMEEMYYIDKTIFPNWWFLSFDNELKIDLLLKALSSGVPLKELNEVETIDYHETVSLLNKNV